MWYGRRTYTYQGTVEPVESASSGQQSSTWIERANDRQNLGLGAGCRNKNVDVETVGEGEKDTKRTINQVINRINIAGSVPSA